MTRAWHQCINTAVYVWFWWLVVWADPAVKAIVGLALLVLLGLWWW